MLSIAMFNNKGGVGKTTLTCNLASFIAYKQNKNVLIIDCDPQCNSTQLIMGQDFAADFYWGNEENNITTISDILQPIAAGDSNINENIIPISKNRNRFRVNLLPGNTKLSIIEDRLGSSWQEVIGGDLGGIRRTNWNTFLARRLSREYDYIFYDLGPSLGSINRSVLMGCDYFITPMGTDIFSILGIKNISDWINSWINLYENGVANCEKRFPNDIDKYSIPKELKIKNGYLGYTIQQYITKSISGAKRPTKAYDEIIRNVPTIIKDSLLNFSHQTLIMITLNLVMYLIYIV